MLHRFWRADDGERPQVQGWGLWLIVALFGLWMFWLRR